MIRTLCSSAFSGGLLSLLTIGGAAAAAPVAVPEPSSLALIAAGIGAVAWLKFRGRK